MSIQRAFLELTERDLASHIVIEHTLFSFLGVLSVQVTEIILKLLVSSSTNRKTDLKGRLSPSWAKFLRSIFSVNMYGQVWIIIAAAVLAFWHICAN